MTEFYVDTTAPTDGDGLSWETAWNAIRPHFNDTDLGAGDHTINCRGGIDEGAAIMGLPSLPSSITIRGNWSGFDLTEDCYRIRSTAMTAFNFNGVQGKTLIFDRLIVDIVDTATAGGTVGAVRHTSSRLEVYNSAIIGAGTVTTGQIVAALYSLNNAGVTTLVAYNSIFALGSYPTGLSSNSRALYVQNEVVADVANCIASIGVNASATYAIGGTNNNSPTPNYYNCVCIGGAVQCTATNCVATLFFNAGNTNSLIRTKAEIEAYYVDAPNGNFTPANPGTWEGPVDLVDKGLDRSAEIGSSLDIRGNDRNSPGAGAAWDIGPYEWGFDQPYDGLHEVTNIDNAGNDQCIYFGQTGTPPGSQDPIKIGDKFSFKETTETNGWGVAIDADGFPIITSDGGVGADSFLLDIDRGSGYDDPGTWSFAIQPTLTDITVSEVTAEGCTVTVTTNSNLGKLYLSIRTAAQGGAYTEGDQELIRDGIVDTDCVYKDEIATPDYTVPQVFTVTGLDPGVTFYVGLAQDVDAV